MADPVVKTYAVAPPLWLLVPTALVTAAACGGVVALQVYYSPISMAQWLGAIGVFAGAALLVFGPSRLLLTAVFLLAVLDHQFRSFAIVAVAGVEWHPRELLLLLLFAHGAVKLWQRRLSFRWTPLHFGILLYTGVFVYMAWRGLWLGYAPRAIVAECRAPLFLGAFWVFAGSVRAPRELHYYGNLAFCALVLLAVATLGAFGYFALTGPVENTQNALGEFVPRVVAGHTIQSIRPSGHAWLEAGFVVALGLLLCPVEPWYRKILYLGLVPLFGAAIAVGFMRTALLSVAVSVAVMLWLNLPRVVRGLSLSIALGAVGLVVAMLVVGPLDGVKPILGGDRSLTARAVETEGALEALDAHPLLGAGLGASFEALGLAQPDSRSSAIPVAYHSLHNVWLYIAWKGGLIGLGLTIVALGGMLLYSHCIVARLPTMGQRCLGRALEAVLVGQLVASVTMPRLTYANGALFLVLWAMAFVLLAESAAEGEGRAAEGTPLEAGPSPFPEPVEAP